MGSHSAVESQVARQDWEADTADALCDALAVSTGGHITSRRAEILFDDAQRLDLLLTLDVGEESAEVAIETVRNAYPRDVQAAIWRLNAYQLSSGERKDVIPLIAAESLSPGARAMLRKHKIAYFEWNGNLYLRHNRWLINIQKPDLEAPKRGASSLFTDAREMVVHALLVNRQQWMTGGELAKISGTSQYTCSMVLQELERREWLESTGSGRTLRRRLARPRELLDAWAHSWKTRGEETTRWYLFTERPDLLLEQLAFDIDKAGVSLPWAFTGASAANVYAPLLTRTGTADIIVPPGHTERFAKALGLKPAEKGANVTLIERDGTSLQFRDHHPEYRSSFASPFILYLDLLDGRGRNKELAQQVLTRLDL